MKDKKEKYAAFVDFFDDKGNYKLAKNLETAYKSSLPNQFEKDFIETDRKVNLLFSAIDGKILKIFPIPNDKSNKWVSFKELNIDDFKGVDFALLNNSEPEPKQAHAGFSSNTDFAGETSSESWDAQERSTSSLVQEARMKGYEGEACHTCQQFTMVRNGSCLKCASCGATSGCS